MSTSTSSKAPEDDPPAGGPGAADSEREGAAFEPFRVAGYSGQVARALRPPDLEAAVARLVDPGAARETLHWGRNYLYAADLPVPAGCPERGPDGTLPVVVKQFRTDGWRARLERRWRGSKAWRSWRAACFLAERGLGTPAPALLIESDDPGGPTYYVCREAGAALESRFLFRALQAGRCEELFPGLDEEAVFGSLGGFLRRLHDAGVWHRDVSIGNLLLDFPQSGSEAEAGALDGAESEAGRWAGRPEVQILDLNRARLAGRPGVVRRTRDLTRLPIVWPRLRRMFLDAYWRDRRGGMAFKTALFATGVRLFLFRNRAKAALRSPFKALAALLSRRRAHPHIPPAPRDAPAREKSVWDHLSDQPHQHAGRLEKARVRLADAGVHLRSLAALVGAAPRIRRRYRELRAGLWREPVAWSGVGVALRPWPRHPEMLLAAVEDLGVRHLLLRLHPWEEDHREEERLARELAARGYELSFALPQNRELVRDPRRWRAAVERLAAVFVPLGRAWQIGQAINRSKWGVWHPGEYLELVASASEVLRAAGEVEILGPSVIDFELHVTAGVVNMSHPGVRFDALASLLYVDRRGAPENRQLGFDTLGKVTLLKAIADTGRSATPRSWITEFNWPLWEGPHSPAGRNVAVDEESQADYLARFYLLALASGQVERAYWWQVVARGYGLVTPGSNDLPRRRPAFAALAQLNRRLTGATCHGRLAAPAGAWLLRFTDATGADLVVAWSAAGSMRATLPGAVAEAEGRDGERLPVVPHAGNSGTEVELDGSPRYFRVR